MKSNTINELARLEIEQVRAVYEDCDPEDAPADDEELFYRIVENAAARGVGNEVIEAVAKQLNVPYER